MGILVSFSGIDGAGKSTQVKMFSEYLTKKHKKFIATEAMFTYFLLKPAVKVLRRSTGSPVGGPVVRNRKIWPKFWFLPAFVDIWLGYIFAIRPLLQKYDFVVADRFYTDIWSNLLYYGYIPTWAFTSLARFLPKADVPLLFVVNPKTVRKREDDFPKDYYEEQARVYKKLSGLIEMRTIDANQSPEAVFRQIKSQLS